jgi:hypothetical protein
VEIGEPDDLRCDPDPQVVMTFLEAPPGRAQEQVLGAHPELFDGDHQVVLTATRLRRYRREEFRAIDKMRRDYGALLLHARLGVTEGSG